MRPSRLAERVRQVFLQVTGRERSSRVVVVGDDDAGVLIVRADEDAFGEIESLAEALVLAGEDAVASPRVIRLTRLPAARLRGMVANIFNPMAQRRRDTDDRGRSRFQRARRRGERGDARPDRDAGA